MQVLILTCCFWWDAVKKEKGVAGVHNLFMGRKSESEEVFYLYLSEEILTGYKGRFRHWKDMGV